MLRILLWRLLGVIAVTLAAALVAWLLRGGPGLVLRGARHTAVSAPAPSGLPALIGAQLAAVWGWSAGVGAPLTQLAVGLGCATGAVLLAARWRSRRRRRYVRLRVEAYRGDQASAEAVVAMFESLHKRLLCRWWRRLHAGQPAIALEVHHGGAVPDARGSPALATAAPATAGARPTENPVDDASTRCDRSAWLAVACPQGQQRMVEAALQTAYPNSRLAAVDVALGDPPAVLRLKKQAEFIKRVKTLGHFEQEREPPVNRLLTAMGACGRPAFVQIALTPAPAFFQRLAKRAYKHHEQRLSRERRAHLQIQDRSLVEDAELRGGLDVQHRPLFFADLRVVGPDRGACEQIASELRCQTAENRLVERGTAVRHGLFGVYRERIRRGEGNPLPAWRKGVYASTELASVWQLPSIDYATVPFARSGLPLAPAPPVILRPPDGCGTLRDALGPVSIHPQLRRQNTAVPGTVEQGKSSYLVATVAEDLRRRRCAVIVLDPKGDAAEAAVSLVPPERTCTLLDLARPTCGFNPLSVDAPADVIADYVVGALKGLFTDADIRASSDRYLRNAIIAVLAHNRQASLWDAARLLSVGEEGYAYRRSVGAAVRGLPEFKEISAFFTEELTAQLADARSTTTAKLDAPVNKLARLLNSASIKRVLLNESLRVDLDGVIAREEVLVVKGALGAMGAGNTAVVMQLLVGMLDAALARQQDLVEAERRVAVALKVDEAPLVLNRGFAETMALKRSAGLETVACWQTDAQWTEREVRDQLDALFAHRVYFATASASDARAAAVLAMAEFTDAVRPGLGHLSALGHPDARLHLPKHHAIASWCTPAGRQAPFIAQTIPLRVDRERLALHAERQRSRGGRPRTDLRQPHWDHQRRAPGRTDVTQASAGAHPDAERLPTGPPAPARRLPANHRDLRPAAVSYRELIELDRAHSVRWASRAQAPRQLAPERMDLQMLALVAALGHVLSSQIHRRCNPGRAATTTQRRLKRLSDAGLVQRFQFHRRDGGGVPMCYAITAAGLRLLLEHGGWQMAADGWDAGPQRRDPGGGGDAAQRLRQARHEVHVAGWVLAASALLGATRMVGESVLSPPTRPGQGAAVTLGPEDLRLPAGRVPHDFLRTDARGQRVEVDRFQTLRPDAIVQAESTGAGQAIDLIVERDDRLSSPAAVGKLERYDHFLAGWSAHARRYGRQAQAEPMVVFVCRDAVRARECARRADALLGACRAYAGEYPHDWEYPGRRAVLFADERDVHEGSLAAWGVPELPPSVRVSSAHGDPHAGEATAQARPIGDPLAADRSAGQVEREERDEGRAGAPSGR